MRRRTRTRLFILIFAVLALLLPACGDSGPSAPSADSDSEQSYGGEPKIPVDTAVYDITGEVVSDVGSLTRQVKPGGGRIDAPVCVGQSGCYGGGGGTVFGPVEAGKGFVRLHVHSSQPATDLAREGTVVLLKVTDTKATALLPGDTVTFRCRRQYENVAAVQDDEKFDEKRVGTWELDFCRLGSPLLGAGPTPK